MASRSSRGRPSTSLTSASTSYPSYLYADNTGTTSRPRTSRRSNGRPGTGRPRTGASTIARVEAQQVVCAVSESRGISPTVGLAFVNLDTGEAVLCQICDSQTYVRTIHKLRVYGPSEILIVTTAASPKSKLFSIIEENLEVLDSKITLLDRRYWAESTGLEYIQQLAFKEDVEAIKISVGGNYFAVCCTAAVLKYIELGLTKTFPYHSLRIKYEPSEGSMMIDVSTIYALELIQNLQTPKSRDCLFGLLNETLTPMGSRLLRSNILQPLTDPETLNTRYDALEELTTKEEMFYSTKAALKSFLDADKILTALIIIPKEPNLQHTEQSVNNIIMLKQFVNSVNPIYEALTGARCTMLVNIRELCAPENVLQVQRLVDAVINENTTYAGQPLELRNQRTYAVKSGVNGLLDVARTTYKEAMEDAYQHSTELSEEYDLPLELKYDNARQFYIRIAASELEQRPLPPVFTNVFRKKNMFECDEAVQDLITAVREQMSILFKICESIAMLDMVSSFAHTATSQDYVRPQITDTLAIKSGRHPIREKLQHTKFIPNDVYATQQTRFQVITGCNMSGKSTYIRSIALMAVMAQIGSFVPAQYASFPILHQLFARVSMDDSIEANVSTFAAEMRETAFILRNIDRRSMAIIDELGRGTSTRDGIAIALAIAEALVESRALVWFATHFRDLATIMAERNGVISLHLAVEITENDAMTMLYKIAEGAVQESHYGLALARVVPLPLGVLEHAEVVAQKLENNILRRKKTSAAVIRERRRKLILNLKEHLVQAQNGTMQGDVLAAWLKELQREFVVRMTAIDEQAAQAETEEDSEDEGRPGSHDGESAQRERSVITVEEESETVSTGETMSE
ncbi:DNA mismatch repair protein MutS [Mytilinidion resinicola]|uniref:DNA mismatch repair protein MutS n=1 Tax=Mytilinidion resinicola TaxID=574789 RepID=A0A6A6YNL0_9PEZI|nr:DNA mismatch repair protein MutS [Mytilinidion resinicola]KAF2810331.1 DNA mismatch repair protein MutS [Mytilinidion resinicola]